MPKYRVALYEAHVVVYETEADSPEEAINNVRYDGGATEVESGENFEVVTEFGFDGVQRVEGEGIDNPYGIYHDRFEEELDVEKINTLKPILLKGKSFEF